MTWIEVVLYVGTIYVLAALGCAYISGELDSKYEVKEPQINGILMAVLWPFSLAYMLGSRRERERKSRAEVIGR